jgi:transcription elongation GreA/GreB family factor
MTADSGIKEKILARCIEIKEESEAHTLAAMNEAQKSANEYGPARDRYDSFRAQLMRKRDMLAQQLAAVDEELRFLRQVKFDSKSTMAESGAMVVLDSQTIFILLGIGKLEFDNNTYYVISPVVPLASAMKGHKAGDTFTFRGKTMKILEIF